MPRPRRNRASQTIANLRQPMPLQVKVWQALRNYYLRLRHLDSCCGHPGQPGC